jgi:hypothetical protein
MRGWRILLIVFIGICGGYACAILGPSCLARQKTGTVTTLNGRLEAGRVTTYVVPYELQGSQNDARIWWDGQNRADGPRLMIYATSVACQDFSAPPRDQGRVDRGECTTIGSAGGFAVGSEIVVNTLRVTGPGNGAPADFREYKLHVVGDARQAVSYSIVISWFFGPDC